MKAIMTGTLAAGFSLERVVPEEEMADAIVARHLAAGKLAEAMEVLCPELHGSRAAGFSEDGGTFVVLGIGLGDGFSIYGPFVDEEAAEGFGESRRNADQEWQVFSPTTSAPADRFTEILQHRIKFWLRDAATLKAPVELDDSSVEHISKLIGAGYREGELCVLGDDGHTEFRGWWNIVFCAGC